MYECMHILYVHMLPILHSQHVTVKQNSVILWVCNWRKQVICSLLVPSPLHIVCQIQFAHNT